MRLINKGFFVLAVASCDPLFFKKEHALLFEKRSKTSLSIYGSDL